MTRSSVKIAAALLFIFCVLGTGAFLFLPASLKAKNNPEERQPRVIIPQNLNTLTGDSVSASELLAREENISSKVALQEGEVIVSVLNGSFSGSPMEEQFVAYRNLLEMESPIYITFISYDESSRAYKRLWSAPAAATRPGTISLYTQDLLGDRSVCVLLTGMNGQGEHTLTIFRLTPEETGSFQTNQRGESGGDNFSKIAELRIDGTITVRETERPQAYQMGFSRGQSFNIAAYGRDFESTNILDQVEIIYGFNTANGLYEQTSRTKIPGSQVEQRRVRELLGNPGAFENFITGLWYYTTANGTINKQQYIYFSPSNREIIFYGDETQQVFTWQNSAATRYGLYVSSQNISITTLRRSIDIELESLESIRIRVFEDVRLNKGVNASWDGSYRKAGPPEYEEKIPAINAHIEAYYDGSLGKIHFSPDGSFEINSSGTIRQGKYSFFNMDNKELLELRSENGSIQQRETYLVETESPELPIDIEQTSVSPRKNLSLLRVRIGARGIEQLYESVISLSLVTN